MAGLFGLFGNKTKYVGEADPTPEAPKESKEAFFLESDAAKSLGDAEYMRKPVRVRRTFPKTLYSDGAEVIREVSSMEANRVQSNGQPMPAPVKALAPVSQNPIAASAPAPVSQPTEGEKTERRTNDNSLDMFRKMAKEIKK